MDFHFSMLSRAALWSRVLCIYTVRLVLIFSLYVSQLPCRFFKVLILSADGLSLGAGKGHNSKFGYGVLALCSLLKEIASIFL